jgi:hypothetical protein
MAPDDLEAQFPSENRQPLSVGIGELQPPVAKLFLEDLVLSHQVVDLLLQNALGPHRQPRCQELQWQWQHRTAGLGLPSAHRPPSTPFSARCKLIGASSNHPKFLRFLDDRFLVPDGHRETTSRWQAHALALKRS